MTVISKKTVKNSLFYAVRFAFRLVPLREPTRDRMRHWFLERYSMFVPTPSYAQTASVNRTRRPLVRSDQRAIGFVEYAKAPVPQPLPATLVAFYLPQYHAIPENDRWWGTGFTEWRSVAGALPQFEGHMQPRLPSDLGFYDLSSPSVMAKQAQLARDYGIGAFCFYFYWFGGETLLEAPLRNILSDPSFDMPFCLCWANEKWSRTWDGRGGEVLIDQNHGPDDDLAFIAHISDYLRDPRYLRVDGKPVLLLYRPGLLPDPVATADRWRRWCSANGVGDIHLVYVQAFERPIPAAIGFDAAVEFPPNLSDPPSVAQEQAYINTQFQGDVLDWRELAAQSMTKLRPDYPLYSGVNCGWDNEPRKGGKGRIYLHSSPRGYGDWLEYAIGYQRNIEGPSKALVFINAWNEWGEGAVLEPDRRLGHAYLQATRRALANISGNRSTGIGTRPVVVVHVWYLGVLEETLLSLRNTGLNWRVVVTTSPEKFESVKEIAYKLAFELEIFAIPNRGRDILPFLHIANALLDEGVEIVLKLHCKRSVHRSDGDAWRRELIHRLIGGNRAIDTIKTLVDNPAVGLVAPDGYLLPMNHHWGANADAVDFLIRRLGLKVPDIGKESFVSGSMFWVRLAAIRPLLDAHLSEDDFEEEEGQVDGTLAHAVERIFCVCAKHTNAQVRSAG